MKEQKVKEKKEFISQELALEELVKFIEKWRRKKQKHDTIKEDYEDVIDAIMDGRLTFDEKMVPTYNLLEPIKTDAGNIALDQIVFRTRIKPSAKADISEGLNLLKQQGKYTNRMIAYIIQENIAMLDKFDPLDFDIIELVCGVFR